MHNFVQKMAHTPLVITGQETVSIKEKPVKKCKYVTWFSYSFITVGLKVS